MISITKKPHFLSSKLERVAAIAETYGVLERNLDVLKEEVEELLK